MGNYNGHCVFSGLPILSGDTVGLVLLAQSYRCRRENCLFYPHDMWDTVSLPIFGKYDELGGIEKIVETPVSKHVVASFKEWVASGELGYTKDYKQYHAEAAKKPIKIETFYDVQKYVHDNSIEFSFYQRGLGVAMFHPEWWKIMQKIAFKDEARWDQVEPNENELFAADADVWLGWAKDQIAKAGERLSLTDVDLYDQPNRFVQYLTSNQRFALRMMYVNYIKDGNLPDDQTWKCIRESLAEMRLVEIGMGAVCRYWLPFLYGNEGWNELKPSILYAKELLKATNKKNAKIKKMCL